MQVGLKMSEMRQYLHLYIGFIFCFINSYHIEVLFLLQILALLGFMAQPCWFTFYQ